MVIDPISDHMYWVEYANGRLQRSDLNGRNITTVLSVDFLSTLDIDIINRFGLYFNYQRMVCYQLIPFTKTDYQKF